jgi:DNA (cytosine-5)-methyltransferase 3A
MKIGNVLSLFDGISCGQIALNRAGISYDNYYASEVDKHVIKATQHNYPNTIQLGSITEVSGSDLPKIDLLIGGSSCQNFSFAGNRVGMSTVDGVKITSLEQYLELKNNGFEFKGESYLFWEYIRLLNEVKPKYFLLENVVMKKE